MNGRLAAGFVISAAMLAGCANLMGRSVVAPEWFETKAAEVKGEGYPDLRGIPETREVSTRQSWETVARDLEIALAELDARTGKFEAPPTPAQIRARAAQLRAGVTDEDELSGETPKP